MFIMSDLFDLNEVGAKGKMSNDISHVIEFYVVTNDTLVGGA